MSNEKFKAINDDGLVLKKSFSFKKVGKNDKPSKSIVQLEPTNNDNEKFLVLNGDQLKERDPAPSSSVNPQSSPISINRSGGSINRQFRGFTSIQGTTGVQGITGLQGATGTMAQSYMQIAVNGDEAIAIDSNGLIYSWGMQTSQAQVIPQIHDQIWTLRHQVDVQKLHEKVNVDMHNGSVIFRIDGQEIVTMDIQSNHIRVAFSNNNVSSVA